MPKPEQLSWFMALHFVEWLAGCLTSMTNSHLCIATSKRQQAAVYSH